MLGAGGDPVRCIPLSLAVLANLFPLLPVQGLASRPDPVDPPVAEGAWLEIQTIPELDQTILYARFPDATAGTGTLEVLDAAGDVRVTLLLAIEGGTGLVVWDGRDSTGDSVPSDVYRARLRFDGQEITAPLVR
jgi:hypothetical protein